MPEPDEAWPDSAPSAGRRPLQVMAGGSGGGAVLVRCPASDRLLPLASCLGCRHFVEMVRHPDGAGALRCSHRRPGSPALRPVRDHAGGSSNQKIEPCGSAGA